MGTLVPARSTGYFLGKNSSLKPLAWSRVMAVRMAIIKLAIASSTIICTRERF
ncbi:MAG: hypothetical protein RIE73_15455 [Coleofasciculus sp. C1-SOL-03]